MIDDNKRPHGREELLYDWFKHLTSLSLLALGGILSLSQLDGIQLGSRSVLIVTMFVGIAGICSFIGADDLVRAQLNNSPLPRSVTWLQRGAAGLLGIGVGAFLGMFLEALA